MAKKKAKKNRRQEDRISKVTIYIVFITAIFNFVRAIFELIEALTG